MQMVQKCWYIDVDGTLLEIFFFNFVYLQAMFLTSKTIKIN